MQTEDYRQIENLIYRYAELIDSGDLQGVAELFRHGKVVSPAQDVSFEGYDNVLALYQNSCRIHETSGTPLTRHVTSNVIIEPGANPGSASARSYYTVFQATDALPLQPIVAGHYHDHFHKKKDVWHFSYRELYIDLMGDCSQHLLYDAAGLG